MKQFEFADFVDEFRVEFTILGMVKETYADNGDAVEIDGETMPEKRQGILLPVSEKELKYAENGTYSTNDKKLYTTEPLELGQQIEYQGARYTIQSFKDYTDYADVYIYIARWRDK